MYIVKTSKSKLAIFLCIKNTTKLLIILFTEDSHKGRGADERQSDVGGWIPASDRSSRNPRSADVGRVR